MKKKILISVCAAVVVLAVATAVWFGVFLKNEKIKNNGNSSGNIVNSGIVAENNEYVFISSLSGKNEGIFKKSKKDGKVTKICEDRAIYLNFYDDELYYSNLSDKGFVYKIDDDGDDRERVGDFAGCEYLSFTDRGVFFEYQDSEIGDIYKPYRADDDFDNLIKLNDDDIERLIYNEGYLYYSNWSDGGKIYKMKCDGTEKTVLNDCYSSFLNVYDGFIYYINDNDNYKIYKMKTDGSDNSVVCDNSCIYFNCYDGYIYYSNETDGNKLYKIGFDGNVNTKISDNKVNLIFIADNKVYYLNESDGNLYSINFDGSDEKIVIE